MATTTVTVTSFENVYGRSDRLHFVSMLPYTAFDSISVVLTGDNDLQWNFVGYDSNGNMVVDQYWFNSGYTLELADIPYLDQVAEWELWIKYTGGGSISPSAVSSAVCDLIQVDSGWYMTSEGLDNHEFLPDVPYLEAPFPVSIWQCNPAVDFNMAFVPLFPDAVPINPVPVKQLPYIMVYDITATQAMIATQNNNGLAILIPTECDDSEELCGMWSLNLVHPKDPEGRYKLLLEGNIVKAGGQCFTIKRTEEVEQDGEQYISLYAEHIWYQYGDNYIFADPTNPVMIITFSGADTLQQIDSNLTDDIVIPGGQVYSFRHASDMLDGFGTYYARLESGCNPIELILGENGLISAKGGELHRDNFYFSVKWRKETARDNAFDIRIGKNLKGIKRTIDTSQLCTLFRLTEANTGMYVVYGWDTALPTSDMWRSYLPHHIIRQEVVSYPTDASFKYEQLGQDCYERFKRICMPIFCYEIDLEDVRDNPDFQIISDESLRCGDIGSVYDEFLGGTLMLEITGTVYDRLTGKCKSIVIGQKESFVYHPNAPIVWDENGDPINPDFIGGEIWVQDSTGRYLYDSNGVKIILNTGG